MPNPNTPRVSRPFAWGLIRRGVFRSVAELQEAIHDYLDRHNADPKPFIWTKTAGSILEKERRALDALDAVKARNQALESEH